MRAAHFAEVISNDELVDWLRLRIAERRPGAVVRFADGEAQFLFADGQDAESMKGAIDKLERDTGVSCAAEDVLELKALMAFAFDHADILGIHHAKHALNSSTERLVDRYEDRVAAGLQHAALSSCTFGHHILDTLPELLRGHRASVISCRDLKPVLESEWGLEDVAVYQLPSEYPLRDVDGAYESTMHHVPMWPDAHASLCEELTVREPGEVFLVGAGVFGKDICVRIRDRGGIALDMGSALDQIAGKLTRGPIRRALGLYAAGTPVAEIASRLERLFGLHVDPDRAYRKITQAVEPEFTAWNERPLQSEYAALELGYLKVAIGDEGAIQDRVCSVACGRTPDGGLETLGIWWGGGEDGAPWRGVLEELRRRGVSAEADIGTEPPEVCTTVQRVIDAHGPFRDEGAATALIYLALARV